MAEPDKPAAPTGAEAQVQPGTVIVPTGAPRQADQRTAVLPEPPSATLAAAPPPAEPPKSTPLKPGPTIPRLQTPATLPMPPHKTPSPLEEKGFSVADDGSMSWTAAEFVAHDKSINWYVSLLLVAMILAGLIFLLTRDMISTGMVLIGAFFLAIYGGRKPKELLYQAGRGGINIGRRYYGYEEFRSFSVAPEGSLSSVVFVPLKRFASLKTLYFDPKNEDRIVGLLVDILPLEEHTYDAVDRFMQRIHF